MYSPTASTSLTARDLTPTGAAGRRRAAGAPARVRRQTASAPVADEQRGSDGRDCDSSTGGAREQQQGAQAQGQPEPAREQEPQQQQQQPQQQQAAASQPPVPGFATDRQSTTDTDLRQPRSPRQAPQAG